MKTMRLRRWLAVSALLSVGCAVGPHYRKPPVVAAPAHWDELPETGVTSQAADAVAWWKTFHDAELDALIARAVSANPDLRIATARLREARAERGFALWGAGPAVEADASFTDSRLSENAQLFTGLKLNTHTYDAGFDAAWEIDLFGGKRRAWEAAAADAAAAAEDRRDVLVSLLAEVARNYV